MTTKYFLSAFTTLLFIQCSDLTQNKTGTSCQADSCCIENEAGMKSEESIQSEITCPKCAHKKIETMPVDACMIKYTCENCKVELFPKEGDCCVFCTYGTHKCPSKQ